jgi:hypothetical protein
VLVTRRLVLAEGGVSGRRAVPGCGLLGGLTRGVALLRVFLGCAELLRLRRRGTAVGRLVLRVDRLRGVVRGPVQPERRILVC